MQFIYKICPLDIWCKAKIMGIFKGYNIDLEDGFIHFSTLQQVDRTLKKYFRDIPNLCLIKVRTKNTNIKWEKSSTGEFFPHLYGFLKIKEVVEIKKIEQDNKGRYLFKTLPLN